MAALSIRGAFILFYCLLAFIVFSISANLITCCTSAGTTRQSLYSDWLMSFKWDSLYEVSLSPPYYICF